MNDLGKLNTLVFTEGVMSEAVQRPVVVGDANLDLGYGVGQRDGRRLLTRTQRHDTKLERGWSGSSLFCWSRTHCAGSSFAAMQSVISSLSSQRMRNRLGSTASPTTTPVNSGLLLSRTAAPTGGRASRIERGPMIRNMRGKIGRAARGSRVEAH